MTAEGRFADRRVSSLKGVGPSIEGHLERLDILTLADLLHHLPHRYEDRTQIVPLNRLQPGEACLFAGQITGQRVAFGRRRSLLVTIEDDTGALQLRFFHFSRRQQAGFEEGRYLRGYGEPRFAGRQVEVAHPEYQIFAAEPPAAPGELTPVYPTTKGIGQNLWRKLMDQVCALPWGEQYASLRFLHQPPADTTMEAIEAAREEIAFDELTAYYLVMKHRARERLSQQAPPLSRGPQLGRQLLSNLGFELTGAQRRVVTEVLQDLEKPVPMLRLVQGDVGSGKTVVAAFAAIRAAEHSKQTAIMAPTEILAEQHYINFSNWLEPLGIGCVLLTGGLKAAERRKRLAAIEDGSALVAIGTHALFQNQVDFNDLGLAIVDEQHRFGVYQRMALRGKGLEPHQLIMTATPIPRTLTMALYADMDLSLIDELPAGRQPIETRVVGAAQRDQVIDWVEHQLAGGEQAYWVCTLIDASDEIEAASAVDVAEELGQRFGKHRVALLHGRMTTQEKGEIMARFKAGRVGLLVSTTVIEVGVDVPNATAMIIENPERLGLAQLHQLRGRVGRGQLASHCVLLHGGRLSENAKARLKVMRDSTDGFYIAEQDLALRGPGEILGSRQTGDQDFRIADLSRHQSLVPKAVERGNRLMAEDPAAVATLLRTWTPGDSETLAV